jgi:hypothetical protein
MRKGRKKKTVVDGYCRSKQKPEYFTEKGRRNYHAVNPKSEVPTGQ